MLYTGLYFARDNLYMTGAALRKYDVWLAAYRSKKPEPGWPFGLWQYTSKGKIPGVSGDVDLSVPYKEYAKIIAKKGLTPSPGGQMTEKQALVWMLGILGSVCAGAITVDKVLDIIHKYLKKAKEPDTAQNLRLDELDRRIGALGKRISLSRCCIDPRP